MSLLRALDRTGHDVVLRCFRPPQNVSFHGGGGAPAAADGPAPAAADGRSVHEFRRVRLFRAPPGASARSLFADTGSDLLVVSDGGFVMAPTDAPRVLLYANSDLSGFCASLTAGHLRSPRRLLGLYRCRRTLRRMLALVRDPRVTVIPNSASTARAYARAAGRGARIGRVVHPPVDLRRFSALRGMQKERRTATVARFGPEKNLGSAVRIMREAGGGYDIVGNDDGHPNQLETIEAVRRAASDAMRLHVNAGQNVLEGVVGGAKAYLQTSEETFGMAVVEAIAAGCVPVVPDHTAHPETVPFAELRYRTEAEAARIVRGALDGRYDGLLPALQVHAQRFSEAAFQAEMLEAIEGRGP